ncbi:hypothetical protein CHUAL_007525 [Chamberlinius hualienensis]
MKFGSFSITFIAILMVLMTLCGREVESRSVSPLREVKRSARSSNYDRRIGGNLGGYPGQYYPGGHGQYYPGGPGQYYPGGPGQYYPGGPGQYYPGGIGPFFPGGSGSDWSQWEEYGYGK